MTVIGSASVLIRPDVSAVEPQVHAGLTKAAKTGAKAFSSVFAQLGPDTFGPLGEAMDKLSLVADHVAEHGKKMGAVLMGTGVAATGLGAVLQKAASGDEAAHAKLRTAIEATGKSYEDVAPKIEETVKHQEHFGHTAADTQDALARLTAGLQDPKKALADMGLAADLAAFKHISLSNAAGLLVKAHAGAGRAFKEFGINLQAMGDPAKALGKAEAEETKTSDTLAKAKQKLIDLQTVDSAKKKLSVADHIALRNATQAVSDATTKHNTALALLHTAQDTAKGGSDKLKVAFGELADRVHGQASAAANTFSGHLQSIKVHAEDIAASIGQKLGPALMIAGPAIGGLGAIMESSLIPSLAGTAVAGAAAVAPFLPLIAAAAALGLAAYELYQHWDQVWGFIKTITGDAIGFVKDHLTIIVTVLTGPLGLAILELVKHWSEIWGTITRVTGDAVGAIKVGIDDIVGFFRDLPGRVLSALGDLGSLLLGVGKDIIHGLETGVHLAWEGLYLWYVKLPETILAAVGDLAGVLIGAGGAVISGLWHGIQTIWDREVHFWSDLPGKILRGVGDLGGLLVGAGGAVISGLVRGITSTAGDIAGAVGGAVKGALNGVIDAINSFLSFLHDHIDFTLPKVHIPGTKIDVGGEHIGFPSMHIPRLHTGGVVPGVPGTEQLIRAIAGEQILARGAAGASVQRVYNLSVSGTPASDLVDEAKVAALFHRMELLS